MKVMYIMPRYHTNLIPTISGWIKNGNDVKIVTHFKGKSEDYTISSPDVVGYSKVFIWFFKLYTEVIKKNDPLAKDIALKLGFPSVRAIRRVISDFKPDLVILRERSLYTIVCTHVCRSMGVRNLLYNQSPLWADSSFFKKDIAHKIVNGLTPEKRITPVNQVGYGLDGKIRDEKAVFAPFVMNPWERPSEKKHFLNDKINILEIGKFEQRKKHFMMIDVLEKVVKNHPDIMLTIVGAKSDRFHEEYYGKLKKYVAEKGLSEYVCLKSNLSREEMAQEYINADLFVLPSTGEPAAISPIEAMSFAVPAICGSGNGTADYIVPNVTGDIFKDKDADDLKEKIEKIIDDRDKMITMGKAAYDRVEDYCSFDRYYEAVCSTGVFN